MKKRFKSLIVLGLSLLLTSCAFKELGNFRIIGINTEADIATTKCVVNFHTNGGTPIDSVTLDQNVSINLKNKVTTRQGHDFIYWSSTPDLKHNAGDSYFISEGTLSLDFYAYWSYDINTPYFYMGKYPSSHVFDPAIKNELNSLEPSKENGKHYDVVYNGKKYRKIQSKIESGSIHVGDWVWFEFEYLDWKFVETPTVSNSYLVCNGIIDAKEMNINNEGAVEDSTLYNWLNDSFKEDAFSIDEQAGILSGISLVDNMSIINSWKTTYTAYSSYMGYISKIWTGIKEDGHFMCYDVANNQMVATDSLEGCGVIPQIKRFHSGEKEYATVTFDTQGGTEIAPIQYAFPKGESIKYKLPKAVKETYFDGDYKVTNFFDYWTISGDSKHYTEYNTSMGNVTFIAHFTESRVIHECNILYFVPNNATNPNPKKIRPTQVIDLADASLTFHDFEGWYLDSDYTKPVTRLEKIYKDSIRIYGKFDPHKFKINYHLGEGGVNDTRNPTEYTYSDTEGYAFELYPPTREHYEFRYWSDSETGYHDIGNILQFSGSIGKDIDIYAIWKADTYKVRFHVDSSKGESFANPVTDYSNLYWDSETGDYWYELAYSPSTIKKYGDKAFPGAKKDHHVFDGWELNGVLITRDSPMQFMNQTLTPHFTYVEYGTYLEYDLLEGMYFDSSAPMITHIEEGTSVIINKPIDPQGHRFKTYLKNGSLKINYDYTFGIEGRTNETYIYYVTYEIIHEGYNGQHVDKCIYCGQDIEGSRYSGDINTAGSLIEFGFYPLDTVLLDEAKLPAGVTKPTKDNHEGWLLDESHGGNTNVSYAYFDCLIDNGNNPRNKVRYLYYFEKDKFFKMTYASPTWKVMSVDSTNHKVNIQCTQVLDFSIFNTQKVSYLSNTEIDTSHIDEYLYSTSYLREYLNTVMLGELFSEFDQEMISDTNYISKKYQTTEGINPTFTAKTNEELTDKIYLQSYNTAGESRYTFPKPFTLSWNKQYDKGYAYIQIRYSGEFSEGYFNVATRDLAYSNGKDLMYFIGLYVMQFDVDSQKFVNDIATSSKPSYLLAPRLTISY